ncbi:MAG: hypothetical protein ACYDBV_14150 [Nitrospiria bacterium]
MKKDTLEKLKEAIAEEKRLSLIPRELTPQEAELLEKTRNKKERLTMELRRKGR